MCFVSTDLSSFSLSPQDKFFSKLTDSGISDEDYQHALNVWNTFQCQDLGKQSKVHFSCSNSFSSNVDVDMNAACNSEIYEVFF